MNSINQELWFRLGVLSTLVKDAPQKPGRTALMKFAYLLQEVKSVPLGYRFQLYTYGPYDSTVLSDLSQAGTFKAIKTGTVNYSSGMGYEYKSLEKGHESLVKKAATELSKYAESIRWVLAEFGGDSASRLELVSTIVFAEREMLRKGLERSFIELGRRVKQIKPYFTVETISETIAELARKKLIALGS